MTEIRPEIIKFAKAIEQHMTENKISSNPTDWKKCNINAVRKECITAHMRWLDLIEGHKMEEIPTDEEMEELIHNSMWSMVLWNSLKSPTKKIENTEQM